MSSGQATVFAAVIALVGVVLTAANALLLKRYDRRLSTLVAERTRDLETLKNELTAARDAALEKMRSELSEGREQRTELRRRQSDAEALVSTYREPLLDAAFDLQSRLFNLLRGRGFFWDDPASYPLDHTLYVFAQYLGWREIIREEVRFLDLGATEATRRLGELLENVTSTISTSTAGVPASFRLYRGEQKAMGEQMMVMRGQRYRCLGYADFVAALREESFAAWFDKLRADLVGLRERRRATGRLGRLQHALIDLIDYLDPDRIRFSETRRRRAQLDRP